MLREKQDEAARERREEEVRERLRLEGVCEGVGGLALT